MRQTVAGGLLTSSCFRICRWLLFVVCCWRAFSSDPLDLLFVFRLTLLHLCLHRFTLYILFTYILADCLLLCVVSCLLLLSLLPSFAFWHSHCGQVHAAANERQLCEIPARLLSSQRRTRVECASRASKQLIGAQRCHWHNVTHPPRFEQSCSSKRSLAACS